MRFLKIKLLFSFISVATTTIGIIKNINFFPERKDFFISKNTIVKKNKPNSIYQKHTNLPPSKRHQTISLGDVKSDDSENPHKDIYQYISDHTFRLKTSYGYGTGWILDFEIPNNENEYPKTWFIASNMHVIDKMKFTSNPYNVVLPTDSNIFKNNDLEILKTKIKVGEKSTSRKRTRLNKRIKRSRNFNKSQSFKTTIKNPELFYHALNFSGPRYDKNGLVIKNFDYYKDFAVLKILFKNSELAKKITNNFYKKYFLDKNPNFKPINLFAPELLNSEKSIKEIYKNQQFFTAGYSLGLEKIKTNFVKYKNKEETIKTQLFYEKLYDQHSSLLLNKHKEEIPGHILHIKDFGQKWNNKKLKNWGYLYVLNNSFTYWGASGSMYIDENKNLLGILSSGNMKQNIDFVEPLMSEGIFEGRKIISPKYDLIRGLDKQNMSYKSQLNKYFPNMNTYLRSINWERAK